MTISFIQPDGAHATSGYTHGIAVSGRLLFVSGQIAFDSQRKVVGPGDVEAQTVQVFENLKNVVTAAGASLKDVVRLGVYLTDRQHLDQYRRGRERYFSEPFPTSSLVIVAGLILPDLLIEVDAIAVLPENC